MGNASLFPSLCVGESGNEAWAIQHEITVRFVPMFFCHCPVLNAYSLETGQWYKATMTSQSCNGYISES